MKLLPNIKEEASISDQKKSDGLFTFGQKPSESSSTFKMPQTFSFGQSSTAQTFGAATQENKPAFSFVGTGNSGLFGSNIVQSTPMTSKFAIPVTTTKEVNEGGDEGEEETPPKVVSVEHSEDDTVYTKK